MPEKEKKKVSFKNTLNLPRTDFPIRLQAKESDPAMLARWEKNDLYKKTFDLNKDGEIFVLHDGPPYANGHLHLGHAYNKILKDIIGKSQRMLGKRVPMTPGWDCHGLPIELNVSKEFPNLSRLELKKKCRVFAQKWVDIQRDEFKQLGVLFNWDRPYLTMNYSFEASIVRAFGQFVAGGYIERKNKTIPWCASCQTVLASAEIEHKERKDPSIYVTFPLEAKVAKSLFPDLDKPVSVLIWTTTPWTLPLNRAVVIKPDAQYVVLEVNEKFVILGKALVDKLCAAMKIEKKVVAEFASKKLAGAKVHHPFIDNLMVPILFDSFVLLDEGTACVHSAPGCGPEDYEIAIKNNLEIFSPLSADGRYTKEIEPQELEDMPIVDGQIWVLRKLTELDRLLFKTSIRHPYPHCWRCHNALIFRATKQWFCDLTKNDLKKKALLACDTIKTVPEKSINRLKATVESRLEWCLSRQRVWGPPIAALLCVECDEPFINQDLVEKVAAGIQKQGIEYWDMVTVDEILPSKTKCTNCLSTKFKKETDILDVWFDSGVTHYAVLKDNPDLSFPADIYLEGKDQHRGWFQSSLLTSIVLNGIAPMRTVITHGFTVDKQGRKMSKSLGNVIPPQELIDKLGTDGLRLWVSSIDMQGDAIVSDALVKNVQQVFRKIRNTCRFLLSNLYDFDIEKNALPLEQLLPIDRYALTHLCQVNHEIIEYYKEYNLTAVFHRLADYCAVDLSSFYLDIVKDRLYVQKADGPKRRSTQMVCWYILDTLTKLIAPILSFTAETLADHQLRQTESIHLQQFNDLHKLFEQLTLQYTDLVYSSVPFHTGDTSTVDVIAQNKAQIEQENIWSTLKAIRSAVLKAIELKRQEGMLKHSLEVQVIVYFDMSESSMVPLAVFFKQLELAKQDVVEFFQEFCIVSQFSIALTPDGLAKAEGVGVYIKVERAQGDKCPRCWQWKTTEHVHKLCLRCQEVIG